MTTVSTPHSTNQSISRYRSAVKVPKLRTGSGERSGFTAAMCIVAPTSIAAAFGCTTDIVRRSLLLEFVPTHCQFLLLGMEGLGCADNQFPKRDRLTASPLNP